MQERARGRKIRPPEGNASTLAWFAIWNPHRGLAFALRACPEEVEQCEECLMSAKRARGLFNREFLRLLLRGDRTEEVTPIATVIYCRRESVKCAF
jgi:hypothetical protein